MCHPQRPSWSRSCSDKDRRELAVMVSVRSRRALPYSYRIVNFWRRRNVSQLWTCPLRFFSNLPKEKRLTSGRWMPLEWAVFPLHPPTPPHPPIPPTLPTHHTVLPKNGPITPFTEEIKVLFMNFSLRLPCYFAGLFSWPSSRRERARVLSSFLR